MVKTSYFVSLCVPHIAFDVEGYTINAGVMANVMSTVFGSVESIKTMTSNVELDACNTEVEVLLDDGKLVGRALVEFDAASRVTMNKTKLSQLLQRQAPWKNCKVEKRAIEPEVLEQASQTMPN